MSPNAGRRRVAAGRPPLTLSVRFSSPTTMAVRHIGRAPSLVYTTNSIEALNSRFRQAVHRRGHFPHEQAALKVLYLCVKRRDKNRSNPTGRVPGWKHILNTLVVTYGERIETAIK
jgi:transposase-like protein